MDEIITLDHGSGGLKTARLIDELLVPAFANPALADLGDAALLPGGGQLVFSTDSFVVTPWRFPGGDIGKLAVCGTVNDLCMAGGDPRFLSCALILEEGFPLADLRTIVQSMADAARAAGVQIVTGDTKVVERGKGDGLYINTAGIGVLRTPGLGRGRCGRATGCWSAAAWAATGRRCSWPGGRCPGRGCSAPTAARCGNSAPPRWTPAACGCCGTPPAAGWPPP